MNTSRTLGIRCLKWSQRAMASVVAGLEGLQSGLFMGLVSDDMYQTFDTYPFHDSQSHASLNDAEAGLREWETNAVLEHFGEADSVLVVAAGGCRELLGLKKLGHRVEGLEYGDMLREHSNNELERLRYADRIKGGKRFELPGDRQFDAAFLARTYLSHIRGRDNRSEFLRSLRRILSPGAPVVLSYYTRDRNTFAFRLQATIANAVRWCRGSQDLPIEVGDHIDPESPLLHHHFTANELAEELRESGFELVAQDASWFGWAVARSAKQTTVVPDESSEGIEAGSLQEQPLSTQ